jgi:hypothetical protein
VMGMNESRMKERRFIYIQCKVPTGWGSLKFRDAGGTGSRHPSSLGARPRPASPRTIVRPYEAEAQATEVK